MTAAALAGDGTTEPVLVSRREGRSNFVVVCDHASNFVPAAYASLGLSAAELGRHIAWDPGAVEVARILSALLDAPLVESRMSRLVVDCNRAPDAPDLIAGSSETTAIPGNAAVSAEERRRRVALAHAPYHAALDELVDQRLAAGQRVMLVSIHSYTPVYCGVARPWHVGVVHDEDERLSAPLLAALHAVPGLVVGDNQPYSPADRVYYTLERHGRARGLPCVMIEIRNDLISGTAGQHLWGERLAAILADRAAGMTTTAEDAETS